MMLISELRCLSGCCLDITMHACSLSAWLDAYCDVGAKGTGRASKACGSLLDSEFDLLLV